MKHFCYSVYLYASFNPSFFAPNRSSSQVFTSEAESPGKVWSSAFKQAVSKIKPSALRSGLGVVLTAPSGMDSIGGLQNVKNELRVSIEWPLTHPDAFMRMGLPQPKGSHIPHPLCMI